MSRRLAALVLLGLAAGVAAQHGSRPALRKDPEFDKLLELVKQAEGEARTAPDRTREMLREALIRTEGLVGHEMRAEVSELRYRIGYGAWGIGDLRAAHDAWAKTVAYRERFDGDAHANTQAARANLALAKAALGELKPASWLQEKVLRVRLETLSKDHKDVQAARQALAGTLWQMGDLDGALRLQEDALASLSATLKDDDLQLAAARQNLALLKGATGDFGRAHDLLMQTLAVYTPKLPASSLDLARARLNLAALLKEMRNFKGARELEEQGMPVLVGALPGEHPEVRRARLNLATTLDLLGEHEAALAVEEAALAAARKVLPEDHPDVQPIRLAIAATQFRLGDIKAARELADRVAAAVKGKQRSEHSDCRSAALLRMWCAAALGDRATAVVEAKDSVRVMCEAMVAAKSPEAGEALAGRFRPVLDEMLTLAVGCGDQLPPLTELGESCLVLSETLRITEARATPPAALSSKTMAARLPDGCAGVVFHDYQHRPLSGAQAKSIRGSAQSLALVLARDGSVTCVATPRERIRILGEMLLKSVAASNQGDDGPARGLALDLRPLVADPVLAVTRGVRRLHVVLDGALATLPLDALFDEDRTPVGERVRIVSVSMLTEPPGATKPTSRPEKALALVAGGTTADREAVPDPPSGIELAALDDRAGIERLARDGAAVRVLHLLATGEPPPAAGRKRTRDLGFAESLFPRLDPGASPAGLPNGRIAGLLLPSPVTAHTLSELPLTACELAIILLPADAETNVHAGRSNVAVASALIHAGARAVVMSLWRASPDAERALLTDFQDRVLVKNEDPAEALWQARMSIARQPGAKWRDWAGWQITVR